MHYPSGRSGAGRGSTRRPGRPLEWLPAIPTLVIVDAAVVLLVVRGVGINMLAVLVATPIVVGCIMALVQRPQRGVLLVAALVPFNGLLLIARLPSAISAWKETLVVATLLASFCSPAEARGPSHRPLPGWAVPLTAFFGLALMSGVYVGGVTAIVALKIGFFYVILALIVWLCPLSDLERDRLVTIIMVTAVVTALIGIVQQIAGPEWLHALGWEWNTTIRFAGSNLRSFSTFNQPFPFGMFLMFALLVALPVSLAESRRLRNRLFLWSTPVLLIALATTIVRGAYMGLAAGLLFLGLRRRKYWVLVAPLPLALAAMLLLPKNLVATALSSSSGQQRVTQWSEWIPRLLSHPFGAGIGATGSAAEKASRIAGTTAAQIQPDNYFYKTIYELGVIGLWTFVVFLVVAFLSTYRAGDYLKGRDALLADGVAASIVAATTACFVATYFEIFPMDVYFWLLLGVVAECGTRSDSTRQPSVRTEQESQPTFANCSTPSPV